MPNSNELPSGQKGISEKDVSGPSSVGVIDSKSLESLAFRVGYIPDWGPHPQGTRIQGDDGQSTPDAEPDPYIPTWGDHSKK